MKSNLVIIGFTCLVVACGNSKQQNKKEDSWDKKYKIAYNVWAPDSVNEDNYEVFIMNQDGSDKKNITNHKDVAWTYMAYQDRIYFISDRDTAYRNYFLYCMDTNGTNLRKVSDLRLEDSWMSTRNNGKEIIVSGRIEKKIRYQLFIINTDNGSYKQITNDTAALFRDPVFSPDGKKIVCAYQKNKRDKTQHEELFILDADGKNLMQLTTYPASDSGLYTHNYKAGPPKWHPTENFISYQSYQNGRNQLFAVSPDGKKHWKLIEGNNDDMGWHDWSSDGKWLALDLFQENPKQFHIGIMNWTTKELKIITDTAYKYQNAPVFIELPE